MILIVHWNESNNVAEAATHARSTINLSFTKASVQHQLKCPNYEIAQPVTCRKKRKRIRKANGKENSYVGGPLRRVRATLNNRLDLSVHQF